MLDGEIVVADIQMLLEEEVADLVELYFLSVEINVKVFIKCSLELDAAVSGGELLLCG